MNWKVRIRNKWFWVTIIPAVLLLVQQVAAIFGLTLDLSELNAQLVGIVGTVFGILAVLGVAVDHTTEGVEDSDLAMTYEFPKPKHAEADDGA